MHDFIQVIAAFPTAIFTFVLGVALLYWLCAMLGFVELDALDVDIPDIDGHMVLNSHQHHSFGENFAGLLMRFGLNGAPVTIVISLVALFGWLISYYPSYVLYHFFGHNFLHFIVGVPIFIGALYFAVIITSACLKPLRVLFAKAEQETTKRVLGQVAIVRSSRVDRLFGEAAFDDGGAGLIIKVRALDDSIFKRGDRVVLLEYVPQENIYRVISEQDFFGQTNNSQN
jgi:Protein of unknown function (DUF1449)